MHPDFVVNMLATYKSKEFCAAAAQKAEVTGYNSARCMPTADRAFRDAIRKSSQSVNQHPLIDAHQKVPPPTKKTFAVPLAAEGKAVRLRTLPGCGLYACTPVCRSQ